MQAGRARHEHERRDLISLDPLQGQNCNRRIGHQPLVECGVLTASGD